MMRQDNDIAAVVKPVRSLYGGGATLGHGDDVATLVFMLALQNPHGPNREALSIQLAS